MRLGYSAMISGARNYRREPSGPFQDVDVASRFLLLGDELLLTLAFSLSDKLYDLLSTRQSAIRWCDHGRAFRVLDEGDLMTIGE